MVGAYKGDKDYFFVSYSHEDWNVIEPILKGLRDETYRFWLDEGISGGSIWNEEIAERLLQAKAMLLFLSESSVHSKYVKDEIQFARNHEIEITPVYIDGVNLPLGLEISLASIQAITVFDKNKIRDRVECIKKILPESVHAITERPFYCGKNYSYYLEEYEVEVPAKPPKHISSFRIIRMDEQTGQKENLFSYEPGVLHGDGNRYVITQCQPFVNEYFNEDGNSMVLFNVHGKHFCLDFYPYTRGEEFIAMFTFCIIDPETSVPKVVMLDCKISTQSHPYSLNQDKQAIRDDIKNDVVLEKIANALLKYK